MCNIITFPPAWFMQHLKKSNRNFLWNFLTYNLHIFSTRGTPEWDKVRQVGLVFFHVEQSRTMSHSQWQTKTGTEQNVHSILILCKKMYGYFVIMSKQYKIRVIQIKNVPSLQCIRNICYYARVCVPVRVWVCVQSHRLLNAMQIFNFSLINHSRKNYSRGAGDRTEFILFGKRTSKFSFFFSSVNHLLLAIHHWQETRKPAQKVTERGPEGGAVQDEELLIASARLHIFFTRLFTEETYFLTFSTRGSNKRGVIPSSTVAHA